MVKIEDQELRKFVNLSLEEQIQLYDSIRKFGKIPERELLRISESTPHNFVNIRDDPNCPMDQTTYEVRKGHIVMVEYEVARSGISRAQAGFIGDVVRHSVEKFFSLIPIVKELKGSENLWNEKGELVFSLPLEERHKKWLSPGYKEDMLKKLCRETLKDSNCLKKCNAKNDLDKVYVVPNPYVATSIFEPTNPYKTGRERRIYFMKLPSECDISIYTKSGHLVNRIHHQGNSLGDGMEAWDLVSRDGMDIAYGIYFYVVEYKGQKKAGRFAVIK